MARRMRDLLAERTREEFVGREAELARLLKCIEEGGPAVVHVHGIGGVGKTTLLDEFARRARECGAIVLRLDCREIEPTEQGLLAALAAAVGIHAGSLLETAERLGSLGNRVALVLDTYEVFRSLDTWLRQVFVPALDEQVRVLFFGREAPIAAWMAAPGWSGLVQSIELGPLSERESLELLGRVGLADEPARRVNRFAHGHPLALTLAASAVAGRPDFTLDAASAARVVEELTRLYLADVRDPLTRQVLDAASVVRRTTRSLLRAMLPAAAPQDAYDRLAALPFVSPGNDGLFIHDTVRDAIAATLQAADPDAYRDYRRAAWRQLRGEVRQISNAELWRYTADMLYLVDKPTIRDVFFPTGTLPMAVEPARLGDAAAIREITGLYNGPDALTLIDRWWEHARHTFGVVRDGDGVVNAYYILFEPENVDPALLRSDPFTQAWSEHLRRDPLTRGQRVLFCRQQLSRSGEGPCAELGAMMLDIKRTYMELRPALRRFYIAHQDVATMAPILSTLGFRTIPEAFVSLDGRAYETFMLDFGPASVDGWLTRLAGSALGLDEHDILDAGARELVVDGRRIALTKLEFGVLHYLVERESQAIPRTALLRDVWGYDYDGGSNVVDAAIRALRKKLGPNAGQLETVTGIGYRYRRMEATAG